MAWEYEAAAGGALLVATCNVVNNLNSIEWIRESYQLIQLKVTLNSIESTEK